MGIKITGIDTPFGGVSWEYTETSKNGIQELFYYLETKRERERGSSPLSHFPRCSISLNFSPAFSWCNGM